MLVKELLADPSSRLAQDVASTPSPVDEEQSAAIDETMADYRARYGI